MLKDDAADTGEKVRIALGPSNPVNFSVAARWMKAQYPPE